MADNFQLRKESGWMIICTMPDVCKTPPNLPVPYPAVAFLTDSAQVPSKVKANGHPFVLYDRSFVSKTLGDQPGILKGLKSNTVGGKCFPIGHSSSFRVNNKYIVRADDQFWMNGREGVGNTQGRVVKMPSLKEVLNTALDVVQVGLDLVGLIPGVGEIADGINAGIYLARGDYSNAALSAAAMIPFAGWAATGAKLGTKVLKATKATTKVAKKAKKAGKGSKVKGKGDQGDSNISCPFPNTKKPVVPTQGSKVLFGDQDTDFELNSAYPLIWQRSYASNSPLGTAQFPNAWYGQGWSHPFSIQIRVKPAHDLIEVILPFGRIVRFPYLEPDDQFYSIFEDITLIRVASENAEQAFSFKIVPGPVEAASTFYHFDHQLTQIGTRPAFTLLCTAISDAYANQTSLAYLHQDESFKDYPSHLQDCIGRILALDFIEIGQSIRLNQVKHLRGLDLDVTKSASTTQAELSIQERLFEAEQQAHQHLEDVDDYFNAKVLVRYGYSADADLIRVDVDQSPVEAKVPEHYKLGLSRRFEWRQHMMTAHHQVNGVSSFYEYDQYDVNGKVLVNRLNTGEQFKFNYFDDHTDLIYNPGQALEKTEQYYFNHKKKLTKFIDAMGAEESYEYDHYHRLIKQEDADGAITEYQYSGIELSKVRQLIDHNALTGQANWREIAFTWENARLVEVVDPLGNSAKKAYDFAGQPLVSTNALGYRTGIKYMGNGLAFQVTDAKGGNKRLAWDAYANLLKYQDCSGHITHYQYDDYGRLTQVTDAKGYITEFKYIARQQQPIEIIYPDQSRAQFKYDALERLVEYRDALDRSTIYSYGIDDLPLSRRDAAHGVLTYHYDSLRRFVGLSNENGQRWAIEYDSTNQVIAETSFDGVRCCYEYSAAGQLQKYQLYTEQDQVRYSTVFKRDLLGQLLEQYIVDHHDLTEKKRIRYRYDRAGQMLEARNQDSHVALVYDAVGQLTKEQLIAHWFNQETGQHVQRRHTLTHLYDEIGNRIETTLPDRRKLKTMYYGSGHAWHYALEDSQSTHEISSLQRNELHQEIQRSQGQLSSQFQLDAMGRLVDQSVNWDQTATKKRLQRQYQYDKAGQLKQIIDQRFQYAQAHQSRLGHAASEQIWQRKQSYHYDELSRLTRSELSSSGQSENYLQIHEMFAFDPASNLLPVAVAKSEPEQPQGNRISYLDQPHQRVDYEYDDLGRVIQKRIQMKDQKAFGHLNQNHLLASLSTRQIDLEWDEQNQLIASVSNQPDGRGGSEIIKTQYCYDPFGRRIAKQSQTYCKQVITTPAKEIQSKRAAPAMHENSTASATTAYAMQLGGKSDSMSSPTWTRPVKRNQALRREQMTLCERQSVWSVWDGNRILQDHNGKHVFTTVYEADSFVPLARLVWLEDQLTQAANDVVITDTTTLEGLQQVAIQNVGELGGISTLPPVANAEPPQHTQHQIYWYQNDHLGTPRELTAANGEIEWEGVYQAWGNTVSIEWQQRQQPDPIQLNAQEQAFLLQPHRFQGQIYDFETGLHYNRFRYYDPDAGRFISHDPIGLLGGDNHYQYAPNPVGWVDPFGLAANRGRIQAQGSKLEESVSWNQDTPLTKNQAKEIMQELEGKLSKRDLKVREKAFEAAKRFIESASNCGGVDAPVSKTFMVKDTKHERVDIEVISGKAFTP